MKKRRRRQLEAALQLLELAMIGQPQHIFVPLFEARHRMQEVLGNELDLMEVKE